MLKDSYLRLANFTAGQGSYHGKKSFDIFTHERSSVTTPFWADVLFAVRYYPHTDSKINMFRKTTKSISFPRPKHLLQAQAGGKNGGGTGKAWRWVAAAALLAFVARNASWLIDLIPRYKLVKVQ